MLKTNHRHCDEYIEDASQPKVLRDFLAWARLPAIDQWAVTEKPKLYATYNGDNEEDKGKRCRVTMASRFGDVGITFHDLLNISLSYKMRCSLEELSDFSDVP